MLLSNNFKKEDNYKHAVWYVLFRYYRTCRTWYIFA